jgi:nicotinamidase-related amidase
MIRNAGITIVIFTGIATELVVESSARDALNRDFYSGVVSYAVSSPDKDAHARFTKYGKISDRCFYREAC